MFVLSVAVLFFTLDKDFDNYIVINLKERGNVIPSKPSAKTHIAPVIMTALTHSSSCFGVVLGGKTGSRGIHQQIVQRAQFLAPTLPCAFP